MKRFAAFLCLLCGLVNVAPAQATQTASLSWSEPSTTLGYGFRVYQIALASTQSACPVFSTTTWARVQDSIPSSATAWSVPGLAAGTTYCYAVTAYNTTDGSESAPSNLLLLADPTSGGGNTGKPPSPTGLSGTRK